MKKILAITASLAVAIFLAAQSAHAFDAPGDIEIHGFLSQGFIQTSKHNNFPVTNSSKGSFNFNDFGINFSKEISPELHVGMQLAAFDRGGYGKDKVTIDWAYGDYRYKDWLGFRAGKTKIPLGLYNEARDNDALRTSIFLPQQGYHDYERDSLVAILGGGVYGSIPMAVAGTLNYQLNVGSVPAVSDGGYAMMLSSMISPVDTTMGIDSISSDISIAHSLEWRTPVAGLRTVFTGLHTSQNGTASGSNAKGNVIADWKYDSLHRYIFGLEYMFHDLTLAAEYELDDYTMRAYNYSDGSAPFNSKQAPESWFVMANYRFNDWFELGSFFHHVNADRHHRDGSSYAQYGYTDSYFMKWNDAALTLRFDPISNTVIKLEGHKINGAYEMIDFQNARKDWYLFAAKVTFSF